MKKRKIKRGPKLKYMSKKRQEQLNNILPFWQLPVGAKWYRLTHNELCLGYHFCYDNPLGFRVLVGPGIKGYNPKCDCDPYDELCEGWTPWATEPFLIVKKHGIRPTDPTLSQMQRERRRQESRQSRRLLRRT